MVCTWLDKNAPPAVRKVSLLFPVVGHSYIPLIAFLAESKEIEAEATIVNPEDYEETFEDVRTLYKLGTKTNLDVQDWKQPYWVPTPKHGKTPVVLGTSKTPANWHFQFVPSKRIVLTKHNATIKVQGETAYNLNMGVPKSICKKGKS